MPPTASFPLNLPDNVNAMHRPRAEPPPILLSPTTTVEEVMTLVDSLALKVYPKGYWQISWTTSALNLIIFFSIAIGMRFYRSRKSPVPLWLFRLERRPVRFKDHMEVPSRSCCTPKRHRTESADAEHSSTSICIPHAPAPQTRGTSFSLQRFKYFWQSKASHALSSDKDSTSSGLGVADGTDDQVQMGSFITASCVNCHFVLTGAYVLLLFFKVVESWMIRNAYDPPPLLDPGFLEILMHAAIFSTGCFAALGYIAILLPNVSPGLWNSGVISLYSVPFFSGLVALSKVAVSASKITFYRTLVYNELFSFPLIDGSRQGNRPVADAPASLVALELAKAVYGEALNQRFWLLFAHGIIAVGGILLALSYLVILVMLTRKVALEIVQLRNVPSREHTQPPTAPFKVNTVTTWPSAAVPFSLLPSPAQKDNPVLTTSLSQQAQFSLPRRTIIKTPPLTPAPSRPLPLPPIQASNLESRCSTPDSVTYAAHGLHEHAQAFSRSVSSLPAARASPIIFLRRNGSPQPADPPMSPTGSELTGKGLTGKQAIVQTVEKLATPPGSPSATDDLSELEFGPRTRLDSQPTPWEVNTLHEDLATNDGYVAVCRFLFTCCMDHIAVMFLCFVFGSTSIHLCYVFGSQYPEGAHAASLAVGHTSMVSMCLFTALYLLNSLNLFAPFLLFPTSQVKLATMVASFTSPKAGSSPRERTSRQMLRAMGQRASDRAESPKAKSPVQGRKSGPRLLDKDSSTDLLGSARKLMSETYSSPSQATATLANDLERSAEGTGCSTAKDQHGLTNPSTVSAGTSTTSLTGRQSDMSEHSSKDDGVRSRTLIGRFATSFAARLSFFHSSPTCENDSAAPAPDKQDASLETGLPASKESIRLSNEEKTSQDPPKAAMSPETEIKAQGFTDLTGVWTFFRDMGPFSSAEMPSKAGPSRSHSKSASLHRHTSRSGASTPADDGAESVYAGCDSTMRRRAPPPGRQMVLDSLISSHALPIQGFYCHRSAAFDSSPALRLDHGKESKDSGISWRTYEEKIPTQQQNPQDDPRWRLSKERHQHQQQQDAKDEVEEELQTVAGPDSHQHTSRPMGEASRQRRQRLRDQFQSQTSRHPVQLAEQASRNKPLPSDSFSSNSALEAQMERKSQLHSSVPLGQDQQRSASARPNRGSMVRSSKMAALRSDGPTILAYGLGPMIVASPPTPVGRNAAGP